MLPYLLTDQDITNYSSFRTPAKAQYFFEIREIFDMEKLPAIYSYATKEKLPIVFLGSGTNVLFAFDEFNGIIVRNSLKWVDFQESTALVKSGELVTPLSLKITKKKSHSLFEKWIGLPGTIWGAIAWNAGCFWFEAKDAVLSCRLLDLKTGEVFSLKNNELNFAYRTSLLKEHNEWFLIEAELKTDLIGSNETDPRTFRSSKQPGGFTCGSFFKNPPGDSAGRLIDQAWLKWMKIGGAMISDIHANFFVHDGHGSYSDILILRDMAKQAIKDKFSIELQEEVKIIENTK